MNISSNGGTTSYPHGMVSRCLLTLYDLSPYSQMYPAHWTLGYGGYFQGSWFRGDWHTSQILPSRSIQWQELLATVAAATIWGSRLANHWITFHCDNLASVNVWSSQSAKDQQLSKLLRQLFIIAASHNFAVWGTSLIARIV